MRAISRSTSALNGASSLRNMMAYGSVESESPVIMKRLGSFAFARKPYSSTSSIGNASASAFCTISNDLSWSLPSSSFSSSARTLSRSVNSFTVVVPFVVTTRLPRKSDQLTMPESARTTMRAVATKCGIVNATCLRRSTLFVVEPHSRSALPSAIAGMRVDGVTDR